MDAPTIIATLADLDHALLERDVPVRLLLLGALAGEHVLLVGPPGTAKSALARRLQGAFQGARYFERLLTRFSVPEELFGPLSLKALEEDRYERLTEGFLPTAQVAFLDEVFKANSAILNALLTLLNEREFDNGSGRVRVPLISVVGATNDVPQDEALQAFHDRFLLRVPVAPVADANFPALLALPQEAAPAGGRISAQDLARLRAQSLAVALPDSVAGLLVQVRGWCAEHQITVSDRRWRKLVGLLQVQAASCGRQAVDAWDLWLLPFALGIGAEQVQALSQWFRHVVAGAAPLDLQWLERAAEACEKQLGIESTAQAGDGADDAAGKLALARAMGADADGADTGMLRMVSERARRRYSQGHVDARLAQVDEALERAHLALQQVRSVADRAGQELAAQLWLPPSWHTQISQVHGANLTLAGALVQRLQAVRAGFAALPVDSAASLAQAPLPMVMLAP